MVIDRIRAFFVEARAKPGTEDGHHTPEEHHLAAAALLVHAGKVDSRFGEAERAKIRALIEAELGLTPAEAHSLLVAAEAAAGRAVQIFGFTNAVVESFSYEERVGLIEMLWEVVYADGALDAFEAQLMRRIGGLLYVTDRDRGLARRRVLDRLGRTEEEGGEPA